MYWELDLLLSWKLDKQEGFTNIAKDQEGLEFPEFSQAGEMVVKYLGTEVKNSKQNDLLHSKALYLKIK